MDDEANHDEKGKLLLLLLPYTTFLTPNTANQVRVQFSNEINKFEDGSNIQVQVMNQFLVNVHLGFLQVSFLWSCFESH